MRIAQNSACRGLRILCITTSIAAVLISFTGLRAAAQNAGAPTPQAAADQAPSSCAPLSDAAIPVNTTIAGKVTSAIEATHLKPGKDIWVNSVYPFSYPGCRLDADAPIYARVMSASASKNPSASEISLQFDRADCAGHNKQPLKLIVIGVVAPPDDSRNLHDAVPTQVRGSGRQISETVSDTGAYDARLSAGGPQHSVKPGAVVGFKNLTLDPIGGPSCSSRLSSTNKNIELEPGAILILASAGAP
jgi:hypothetical protein